MSKSKILEALALVGLYPGDEFRIAGSDTAYYIDKVYGIFRKNDDVISNERLLTVLSSPDLIIKCRTFSQEEKEILKALYTLGFRYVARDEDSLLYCYEALPYKEEGAWSSDNHWFNLKNIPSFKQEIDFQYIGCEDENPFDIKAFLEGEGYEI